MKVRRIFGMMLVALMLLAACLCASAEERINPAYEYYYQQLTPNQQAIYRLVLEAPHQTEKYTLKLPENGYSLEKVRKELHPAIESVKMDHPEVMAWLFSVADWSYDASRNAVTFTLTCQRFYDPEDQMCAEKLLDKIVAAANPEWDRYTKAWFVSNVVQAALDYDPVAEGSFYTENGKADYYNSNILCINNGYAVCEGFSQLYKVIADRIGLPCVVVGSVSHAWIHVLMEDGNWYGQEPQNPVYLQGASTLPNSDMYELYDGFFGGGEMTNVRQPERTIDDYLFSGASVDPGSVDLTQARLDASSGKLVFEYTVNVDGTTCTITGFSGKESGDLVIPEVLDGYTVTAIGNSAFTYADFEGRLVLPDSIEKIGEQAFNGCARLSGQLILPSELKTIENAAFAGCSGFTGEIVFNNKLQRIARAAFGFCGGLTGSLMLPDSIVELEHSSFFVCNGLDGILHIPEGIHEWSAYYVDMCDNLSGFDVSPGHPSFCVADGILYSKDMTRAIQCVVAQTGAVVIPEGVITIGNQAFYRCEKITSVSLPSTVKRIEEWAFAITRGITEPIALPEGLEFLERHAFQGCSGIQDLVIPGGVQLAEDGGVFDGCEQLTSVIIEDGLTTLPTGTFNLCTKLSHVYLPSTITSINDTCFYGIYGIKIFGKPGSAAEMFVNSEAGKAQRAVFCPVADKYVLFDDEISLSLLEADNSRTHQLTIAPYLPVDAVVWASEDEAVATVKNGLVTGVSVGQTVITATFGETKLRCPVVVHDGIQISADGKTLIKVSEHYTGELVIPEGVERIAQLAIVDVEGLTGIIFPNTLTTLDYQAVCRIGYPITMKSLVLPESVLYVSDIAFENCRAALLQYPVNAVVGERAFSMCSIETLEIPEGVTELPQRVFYNGSIIHCYLPASLTYAPINTFEHGWVGTFYIYRDTYAEEYLQKLQVRYPEMGFNVVHLEQEKPAGDVNEDGRVDIYDALLVLQYNAGWDVELYNGDMDGDGVVSLEDALKILEICLNGDMTKMLRALETMLRDMSITPLVITEQPVDEYVEIGAQAKYEVQVNGEAPTYQWYINRNDGKGWCKLNGAVYASCETAAVTLQNNGDQYRCVITDVYGNELVSDVAAVHVVTNLPMTGDAAEPLLYVLMMLTSIASLLWLGKNKIARE